MPKSQLRYPQRTGLRGQPIANRELVEFYTLLVIIPYTLNPIPCYYRPMSNNSFLQELNERQREAATFVDGALLILAGAGSGKTKTLTHRIAYLIGQGIPPHSILAITFTNKAAEEMRTRISALLIAYSKSPTHTPAISNTPYALSNMPFIGTFHSFCNRILRQEAPRLGFTSYFTIYDEDDSLGLIKEIQKDLNLHPKQFPAGVIAGTISRLKSELVTDAEYRETAGADFFPQKIAAVYTEYQKRLYQANGMDFDDLIMKTVELFERHPSVLAAYQDRFRYIHVDEYQDTNVAQYRLVRLLGKKYGNVAVVGDDAQSIYAFRHADYRNILNFERDWPRARTVVLDENYRSTQTILDVASDIIEKNIHQKKKRLWTSKKGGERVASVQLFNERSEARFIVNEIESLQNARHYHYSDIAVLYRTNAQSRILEEVFLEHDIPYTIIGGVRFYARKEIKDLIAYIRYALNEKDSVSLKRIINTPPRKIGKQTFLKFLMDRPLRETERVSLETFRSIIRWLQKEIRETPPSKLVRALVKKIRYEEYLEDSSKDPDVRMENIREFESLARRYDTMPRPEGLIKMLEDAALFSEAENADGEKEGVRLMTVHSAKGLEFPIVFLTGLEEGIFPHSRSATEPALLEEERRLCYVGITRAKERCYLLHAGRRTLFGSTQANIPSRFLAEISPEHIETRESETWFDDDDTILE